MVRFAAATGAGDLGFPICGFVVESAECFSTLGDGRPGFVGFGDIGHEAPCGEGDVTALGRLSLRHTETTSLLCRGRRLEESLGLRIGWIESTDSEKYEKAGGQITIEAAHAR